MKKKLKFLGYWVLDHKSLQEHLNRCAAQCWAFTGFLPASFGLLGCFEKCEKGQYSFCVDWFDPLNEDPGYLELCAEAGWDEICTSGQIRIFRSRAGESPEPIHTDAGIEYSRFFKKILRRTLLGSVFAVYIAAALIWAFFFSGMQGSAVLLRLVSNSFAGLGIVATIPLYVLGGLIYLVLTALRLVSWRSSVMHGGRLESAGRSTVNFARVLNVAGALLTLALAVLTLLHILSVGLKGMWPFIIGGTLGIISSALLRKKLTEETRKRQLCGWFSAVGIILGFGLLHLVFPTALDFCMPQSAAPPVFEEEYALLHLTEQKSPLVSYDKWHEYPENVVGTDKSIGFERYVTMSDSLADMAAQTLWYSGVTPDEEFPNEILECSGQWYISSANYEGYIIRRGNSVMTVTVSKAYKDDFFLDELCTRASAFLESGS